MRSLIAPAGAGNHPAAEVDRAPGRADALRTMTPGTPPAPPPPAPVDPRRTAYESARLRLARLRVHGGASLRKVFHEATTLAARTLDVDRATIWLFVDDRAAIRCFE